MKEGARKRVYVQSEGAAPSHFWLEHRFGSGGLLHRFVLVSNRSTWSLHDPKRVVGPYPKEWLVMDLLLIRVRSGDWYPCSWGIERTQQDVPPILRGAPKLRSVFRWLRAAPTRSSAPFLRARKRRAERFAVPSPKKVTSGWPLVAHRGQGSV